MKPSPLQPSSQHTTPQPIDRCLLLIFLMWIPVVALTSKSLVDSTSAKPTPLSRDQLNPNIARWWELSTLPQIGIGTSRAIARFREDASTSKPTAPVFRHAADLVLVRGIGPKTVLRIAPHLDFGDG